MVSAMSVMSDTTVINGVVMIELSFRVTLCLDFRSKRHFIQIIEYIYFSV